MRSLVLASLVAAATASVAAAPSPSGVRTLNPPGAMFEARKLFDGDIIEIDSTFYAPQKK